MYYTFIAKIEYSQSIIFDILFMRSDFKSCILLKISLLWYNNALDTYQNSVQYSELNSKKI